MDFKLDAEQEEFRKLALDFATREMMPLSAACDRDQALTAPIYKKIFDTGLINVQLSETLGGLSLSLWSSALIAESLAFGCSGIAAAIEYSALAQLPVLLAASEIQQETFLAPLQKNSSFAGIALESVFNQPCEIAFSKTDGFYRLSGRSSRLLNSLSADWFIFDALDKSSSARLSFIVPKETTGLEIKEKLFSLGRKAADINAVELHEVSVPAANCLSTINQSDNLSKNKAVRQKQTSSSFVLLAAGMVGVAQSAFEHSRRYSKERQTFGKPIAQHQSIAFMMANMAKDIEAARELVWQAAILVDKGCESAKEASAAILFASETVMQVTTDAVQIFGGYGYSKEYPVEKLMRDAKTYQCMLPYSCLLQADLGKVLLEV